MNIMISGRRYNTETAKKLGCYNHVVPDVDNCYHETLYRKKSNEYFLYFRNASESRITPISIKKAMEWAKIHLDGDEYEIIFGDVSVDGKMPDKFQLSFWISEGQKKQTELLAATHAEIYAAGLNVLSSQTKAQKEVKMNKMISGRRYNTETAKKLGCYNHVVPDVDNCYHETLYRKKSNEYFLYFRSASESRITPISIKKALEWAKIHLDGDEYEIIFGDVSVDGKMPDKFQLSFWISEGQKKLTELLAATQAEIYAAGLNVLSGTKVISGCCSLQPCPTVGQGCMFK